MRFLKITGITILLLIAWAAAVPITLYLGWFSRPIAPAGDTDAFVRAAKEIMVDRNPPAIAFALIKNGQLYGEYYGSSVGATPNADSLFPIASLSKWVTAYGVLSLCESGQLELDHPVPDYLHRWHLPPSQFDNNKVTTRLLLSHRAGLHDGLGFGNYAADEQLPSLEESLSNPRASSGKPVRIAVTSEPGSGFSYSGGSYHLLELVSEEVSGKNFKEYMHDAVFQRLGMTRSNYNYIGGQENSVRSYTAKGELAPQYQYASAGATALNTSIRDLVQLVRAQIPHSGVAGVVSEKLLSEMRQPATSYVGVPIWGMGAILSSRTENGDYITGGDGANDPEINTSVKINPTNGDAIIVLVNGRQGFATAMTSRWAHWQTGRRDWQTLIYEYPIIGRAILYGWLAIVIAVLGFVIAKRRHVSTDARDGHTA